jgi:hypothetical protein
MGMGEEVGGAPLMLVEGMSGLGERNRALEEIRSGSRVTSIDPCVEKPPLAPMDSLHFCMSFASSAAAGGGQWLCRSNTSYVKQCALFSIRYVCSSTSIDSLYFRLPPRIGTGAIWQLVSAMDFANCCSLLVLSYHRAISSQTQN